MNLTNIELAQYLAEELGKLFTDMVREMMRLGYKFNLIEVACANHIVQR